MKHSLKRTRIPLLGAVALNTAACSFGSVTDGSSGVGIGHAEVRFESMATTQKVEFTDDHTVVPPGYQPAFSANALALTWDAADPGSNGAGNQGLWYLNPYGSAPGDGKKRYVTPGYNRVKISKPGYDTLYFYTYHSYQQDQVTTDNPYSAGPYAFVNPSAHATQGQARAVSFELYPTSSVYERLPDLFVDPRTLNDYEVVNNVGEPSTGVELPASGCEGLTTRCLRYSVGIANVGRGDLWIVAPSTKPHKPVKQRVLNTASGLSSYVEYTMPEEVGLHQDQHTHLHFPSISKTRLRSYSSSCSSFQTAANCPVVRESAKTSFCLEDYRSEDPAPGTVPPFEPGLTRRQQFVGCESKSLDGQLQQGIGAGYMDTYRRQVIGQLIDIAGLPAGTYWLEVETNPDHYLREVSYDNNISRVTVVIP